MTVLQRSLLNTFRDTKRESGDSLTYDEAVLLARLAHWGQRDKSGIDYAEHVLRVGARARDALGEEAGIIGLLHDVLDDCGHTITPDYLTDIGCNTTQVQCLVLLQRPSGMSVQSALEALVGLDRTHRYVEYAQGIKALDLDDNRRLPDNPTEEQLSRSKHYLKKLLWFSNQVASHN